MTKALENNEFQINAEKIKNFLTLCKLRVNSLIVFTAVIGMPPPTATGVSKIPKYRT